MSRTSRSLRAARRRGFTLMEVLLVLAILVILGSLVTLAFQNVLSDSESQIAKSQVGSFEQPVKVYLLHMRTYPPTLQALMEPPADVDATKWKGPYMDKAIPKDPWGNDYRIQAPGTHNAGGVDIWSAGPDGQDGSADDIGNWESGA